MPDIVSEYKLLISCPGDVREEISLIEDVVREVNSWLASPVGVMVQCVHWAKDAYPEQGAGPQKLLNRQLVDVCDMVVAIFWTRFGSGTGTHGSGTEEEIERSIRDGKYVFLYFCDREIQPSRIDFAQYEKVKAFRQKCAKEGYYSSYDNLPDFKEMFRKHLVKYIYRQHLSIRKTFTDSAGVPGTKLRHISRRNPPSSSQSRTSWMDYNGLMHLDNYLIAYIPIVNTVGPGCAVAEYSAANLEVRIDETPYVLPEEFETDKTYKKRDSRSCRLSGFEFDKGKISLRISRTSYHDYLKSGEHLDEPYEKNPDLTNRDFFGSTITGGDHGEITGGGRSLELYRLTNICGCGLFILTSDEFLMIARQPERSTVYPGRLTYATSGTMSFAHPNPFKEIRRKAKRELGHDVTPNLLTMIGFGADARKLYFQFSFVEKTPLRSDGIGGLIPVHFDLKTVIKTLVENIWEPAAEATLLTLCVQRFGYRKVLSELRKHEKKWGEKEILDEWDYRATCGTAATLSTRYPEEILEELSEEHKTKVLSFMEDDINGKSILEIGSGDGRITKKLAARAREITCVDICDRMLKKSMESLGSAKNISYEKTFAQNFKSKKYYDVALISLVLIHNVSEEDFQGLIGNIVKYAGTVYVFEDVSKNRKTGPFTKLRSAAAIEREFGKHGFKAVRRDTYFLHNDKIACFKFVDKKELHTDVL